MFYVNLTSSKIVCLKLVLLKIENIRAKWKSSPRVKAELKIVMCPALGV
jgi:hypothetical protein